MHDDTMERWRSALLARDFTRVEPELVEDARFGSCVGRAQVVEYLVGLFRNVSVESVDVEAHPDRLIAMLELSSTEPDELPFGRRRLVAVGFVRDGRIVELQTAADRDEALAAIASPPPPARPASPTRMTGLAAVLPVRDLSAALEHYGRLGFAVSAYDGGGYGYARRDGLHLHFNVTADLDPARTTSAVYLYVDDADRLFAEWRSAGVSGQFFAPHDTEYGLREGAHIDRDGNLLRFGSPLQR